ncbi:ChaN family lipoprotein [Flavobacterium macacae]|uniref:Iron-regulated protein n=1 Tax=Flavobacterium macacae TaxID=2488993 RepID=A0A3P3W6T6_9FLAO|nr:ChaN family lipoprotein [Flavobacterium macacae]RRJ89997.1 iron-regulated protein [Flavobacterium macacae]
MKCFFCLMAFVISFTVVAQDKLPYQLYDKSGKKTTYKKMVQQAKNAEVVLFGEHHDNSIVHWLQLEFTKDLFVKKQLVLGAEMIEADNQKQLNQYLKGEINQKAFDTLARLWNNHKTDYKPLVDFAKGNNLNFVATNVPRRYASLVYKQDFQALDKLSEEEKTWMAPLPIKYDKNLPGYVKMLEMMGDHASETMPKAQAIKDATMGHFILQNLKPNTTLVHYNGSFHSDNFDGIYWYLKQGNPELKIMTIATVSQKDISRMEKEHLKLADFIIVVDKDVTKTF